VAFRDLGARGNVGKAEARLLACAAQPGTGIIQR